MKHIEVEITLEEGSRFAYSLASGAGTPTQRSEQRWSLSAVVSDEIGEKEIADVVSLIRSRLKVSER